jgi:LCP family protein required for cell wall assembly
MPTRSITEAGAIERPERAPRAFIAGLLSAFVPGSGQMYANAWRRGAVMLAVAVVLGAAALAVYEDSATVLRLALSPEALLALLGVNLAVFLWRAHCTVDAYRVAGRRRSSLRGPAGTLGGRVVAVLVLVVVVALPHVVAGYYTYRDYDLLTSVFAEEEPIVAAAAPEIPEVVVPTGIIGSVGGPVGGGAAPSGTVVVAQPEPEPEEPPPFWKERGRLNVLLVGADAGPGRWGLRTDTMIVVSIDTETKRTAIFSVPRNLQGVPFPPSARTDLETFPDILNALWQYAEGRPELFPGAREPGPTALKATLGHLLGLRIDYYAMVDLRGFVEVVDALGGVTVNVPQPIYDAGVSPPNEDEEWIVLDLDAGRQHLDGRTALAYVRTRWASSDYDRMQRQRCTIAALAGQASLSRLLRAFPKLATTMKKYVRTDIPVKQLPDLIELITRIETSKTVAVSFVPPVYSPWADPPEIRASVRRALRGDPLPDETTGLVAIRNACA